MTVTAEERAAMSSAAINDLPDSAFAYIEPGGTKDAEGKTTPRSKRHFPVHDAAHVRNALARASQSPFGDQAMPKIKAAAKQFGIDVSEEKAQAQLLEFRRQRRSSMLAIPERISLAFAHGEIEMRAKANGTGGTAFEFNGYAATFNDPFEMWDRWGEKYTEEVQPGAFSRTLANSCDTAFLIGHWDAGILMARTKSGTMQLGQDSRGLPVHVPALDGSREDVRTLASAVDRGDMDEMSCAFVTRQQQWDENFEHRSMLEMDLHRGDVSAVVFGANPATAGSAMVPLPTEMLTLRRPVAGWTLSEHRGNPVDQDLGDASDYDPWDHAAPGTIKCGNDACPVDGGALNHPSSKFCAQCGSPLYGGDALVRLDDAGIPAMEEEQGAAASLSLRQRELELLALAG